MSDAQGGTFEWWNQTSPMWLVMWYHAVSTNQSVWRIDFTMVVRGTTRKCSNTIGKSDFSKDLTLRVFLNPCLLGTTCGPFKTHWGRVTHICINKLNIIGSNNGLWPGRRQAIIWTSAGMSLIGPLGTKILTEIHTFWIKKMHFKLLSGK